MYGTLSRRSQTLQICMATCQLHFDTPTVLHPDCGPAFFRPFGNRELNAFIYNESVREPSSSTISTFDRLVVKICWDWWPGRKHSGMDGGLLCLGWLCKICNWNGSAEDIRAAAMF